MIVLGILGIVMVAFSQMVVNLSQQQRSAELTADVRVTMTDIGELMRSNLACTNSFGGFDPTNPTPFNITSIKDDTNTGIFNVGEKYLSKGVELVEIAAGGTTVSTLTTLPGYKQISAVPEVIGRMLVVLSWEKTNRQSSVRFLTRFFYLNVKLDAAQKITDCSLAPLESNSEREIMILQHALPSGTPGDNVNAVWVTKVLNRIQYNSIADANLAANTISLPKGTYVINSNIIAKGDDDAMIKSRLFNQTTGTPICMGQGLNFPNQDKHSIITNLNCAFTLAAPQDVILQVISTSNNGTFGPAVGSGEEIYANVMIERIKD